ncbi:MAG: putative N-acetylmannosamine-6-phosphate 2-epimerase [Nakamurella sp.]
MDELAAAIHGRLVVSCQAPDGHPLRDTDIQVQIALAAVAGGAAAIRCGGYGGLPDITAIAEVVSVPVIGLTKEGTSGVFITPTVRSAVAVIGAGAAVAAVDATGRDRPDGSSLAEVIAAVHAVGGLLMADIASLDQAEAAVAAGADLVGTTLSGYLEAAPVGAGPDLRLVADIRERLPGVFLVAEGRYGTPELAAAARTAGADTVVVGTAITDPAWITGRYAAAVVEADRRPR